MSQTGIPPPRNAARTSCGFCEGGSGQKAEGDVTVHVFGLTVAKEMQASRSPAPTSGRWEPTLAAGKITADNPGSYSVPVTVIVADGNRLTGGAIAITNNTPRTASP